jgi:thiol-disulfide isomerase/thioredoxin
MIKTIRRISTLFASVSIMILPWVALAQDAANPSQSELAAESAAAETALRPLADLIKSGTSSRATVECTGRTMILGQVTSSEKSLYQVASRLPNQFRVQLKADAETLQLISDGKLVSVLLADQGYFQIPSPQSLQELVGVLPVPLGPYPEPIMALTLPGVDMMGSLLAGLQSLQVVNQNPYDDEPAVLLRGLQADGVGWSLWVATDPKRIRPLRMKIDLTAALGASNQLPEGFVYELDLKFTGWRMGAEVDESLFAYQPPAEARKFESLEDYFKSMSAQPQQHPLLGQAAPEFTTEDLDGNKFELVGQRGKVVVLDFWATWCGPCVEAMPVISEVAGEMAEQGVVVFAVNIGEGAEKIKPFMSRLQLSLPVVMDPEGKIAAAYAATAIPQTVLIGKDGRVEVVHVGISGPEAFKAKLSEQLKALVAGEKLAQEPAQPQSQPK